MGYDDDDKNFWERAYSEESRKMMDGEVKEVGFLKSCWLTAMPCLVILVILTLIALFVVFFLL